MRDLSVINATDRQQHGEGAEEGSSGETSLRGRKGLHFTPLTDWWAGRSSCMQSGVPDYGWQMGGRESVSWGLCTGSVVRVGETRI